MAPCAASASATVVGNGTPAGCTSAAVVAAVAKGGTISFDCGPGAVTIDMAQTAKVVNTSPSVVLNGGGKVTLSGQGAQRILYMDTCDRKQGWTTSHCQQQATPKLMIENMTFQDGDSSGDGQTGGGAVYAFGGRLTIRERDLRRQPLRAGERPDVGGGAVAALWQDHDAAVKISGSHFSANVCDNPGRAAVAGRCSPPRTAWRSAARRFDSNSCAPTGPDVGGAAVRAYVMHGPVVVTRLHVQRQRLLQRRRAQLDRRLLDGRAQHVQRQPGDRHGRQPAGPGDARRGQRRRHLQRRQPDAPLARRQHAAEQPANEGGGAIFFVSDNRTGTLSITGSKLIGNPSQGFETAGLPGIYFLGAHAPTIRNSVLKP